MFIYKYAFNDSISNKLDKLNVEKANCSQNQIMQKHINKLKSSVPIKNIFLENDKLKNDEVRKKINCNKDASISLENIEKNLSKHEQ